MQVEKDRQGFAHGSFVLPTVEFFKPLLQADLNMAGEQLHGGGCVLPGDRRKNFAVLVVDVRQERRIVSVAVDREDANQQTRLIHHFQYSSIRGHANQQSVKSKIARDEAMHLLLIQPGLAGFLQVAPQM